MKAYLLLDISVHDMERYKKYTGQSPDYVAKHQGHYLVRGGAMQTIEGDWAPQRLVIIEFPAMEHAEAFLRDPEYQSIANDRRAATISKTVLVEGT